MPSQKSVLIWVAIIGALGAIAAALISRPWEKNEPPKLHSYTGRVVDDNSNRPIPNATISLELGANVPVTVQSDELGVFHFETAQSSGSVRIRVEAKGYETLTRNVSLDRTSLEDVRLKAPTAPDKSSINTTFPANYNPTIEAVRSQLASKRGVRIGYAKTCKSSVKQAVVELNSGQLTGKDIKEFLENAAVRANVKFSVKVIQEGASYEIVCQ